MLLTNTLPVKKACYETCKPQEGDVGHKIFQKEFDLQWNSEHVFADWYLFLRFSPLYWDNLVLTEKNHVISFSTRLLEIQLK